MVHLLSLLPIILRISFLNLCYCHSTNPIDHIPPSYEKYSMIALNSHKNSIPNTLTSKNSIKPKISEPNSIHIYRILSNSCEIKHCVECSKDKESCSRCASGYSLKSHNCTESENNSESNTKQMKIIIIMAFISVPLILIVFCCFIYLFFRKKPANRQIYSESIMTEMQMAFPSMMGRGARQRDVSRRSADSLIGTGMNLLITQQNFESLFPVFKFESSLNTENCTVCFEEFSEDNVLRITPCKHVFHHECLFQWLVVNDQKRCPNDNTKLC